ncbi:MAG: hypothetical protein H0U18_14615 [Pyrinomonadaceae bacterium]|nr:hypothetical protein [Pyrinomonadaceae bacterium]
MSLRGKNGEALAVLNTARRRAVASEHGLQNRDNLTAGKQQAHSGIAWGDTEPAMR